MLKLTNIEATFLDLSKIRLHQALVKVSQERQYTVLKAVIRISFLGMLYRLQ